MKSNRKIYGYRKGDTFFYENDLYCIVDWGGLRIHVKKQKKDSDGWLMSSITGSDAEDKLRVIRFTASILWFNQLVQSGGITILPAPISIDYYEGLTYKSNPFVK